MSKKKRVASSFKVAGLMIVASIVLSSAPSVLPSAPKPVAAQGVKKAQRIPPKFVVGDIPQSILDVKTDGDFIYDTIHTIAPEIEGYDDVLLHEHLGLAYLTGRAGIHRLPGIEDTVILTISRRGGGTYPKGEQVGLYTLNLSSLEVAPLVTRVPHSADVSKPTVFATAKQKRAQVGSLNRSNSRLLAVCNDAAVSADGKRIYFTESYVAEGATMGGSAALKPIIMLGRTGRLWMYDSEDKTVGLVANGYAFTDGILMEGNGNEPEESVLLTDNPRFQLHRVHLAGARAGESEVLWRDLPGLADGMRRDSKGRIWLTIITNHGNQIPWVHAHPGVKPMLMKHPQLISFPSVTSLLLLSPDASTANSNAQRLLPISPSLKNLPSSILKKGVTQ
ncbi:MAG: SMP-30/gluconolactonase/LRE family protein [Deltaproteobacteria bacterium]|nr:SMP-30/gluconolactonase/LRE family protein [Deltaproteobacteria bacterium]